MRTVLKIALTTAICMLSVPTWAQQKAPSAQEVIQKQDTDNDGKISRAEATGRLSDNFDEVDTNADGYITLEELKAVRQQLSPKAIVQKMDADGDGKIAKSEAKGRVAKRFDKIDRNKDGFITEAELAQAQKRAMQRR